MKIVDQNVVLESLPRRAVEAIRRALNETPMYGEARRQLGSDPLTMEAFRRLPCITKKDIRAGFPHGFLPAGVELEALLEMDLVELEHTSGTSESRTPLLLGKGWWAAQEERALRLNRQVAALDEFPEARRVTINSPSCSGDICYKGVPSRGERVVGSSLFVNLSRHPFLWGEADLDRMVEETLEWEPQFLDVDPVYGALFARHCERRGVRLPSLQLIVASYEYVSHLHRRLMERAFGVPVYVLYGSTETGHLLMETGPDDWAPSLGTAFLETLETDAQGISELCVTTLTNPYMPLMRYRIGDLVSAPEPLTRSGWRLHGRLADAFYNDEGRRVTTRQVDECFHKLPGFLHYQLAEVAPESYRLRYVVDHEPPRAAVLTELRTRLHALLRPAKGIEFQEVDGLLSEPSGKFRLGYPLPRRQGICA